jgi:hypothetical protein
VARRRLGEGCVWYSSLFASPASFSLSWRIQKPGLPNWLATSLSIVDTLRQSRPLDKYAGRVPRQKSAVPINVAVTVATPDEWVPLAMLQHRHRKKLGYSLYHSGSYTLEPYSCDQESAKHNLNPHLNISIVCIHLHIIQNYVKEAAVINGNLSIIRFLWRDAFDVVRIPVTMVTPDSCAAFGIRHPSRLPLTKVWFSLLPTSKASPRDGVGRMRQNSAKPEMLLNGQMHFSSPTTAWASCRDTLTNTHTWQ